MKLVSACFLGLLLATQVKGHGRLVNPPSRSTAWRHGFNTPKNYNDHELYCGGWSRQHQRNGGRCGVCGDPFDLPAPRPNEGGGAYSTGTIVRAYEQNSVIEIGVELTANHNGYFEFRLCPQNNPNLPETDDCFDRHLLQRADGQGPRYFPGPGSGIVFTAKYQLPEDLSCVQCVLQWRYIAGNNWGTCANGTSSVGCGPQEEFRACADVRISAPGEESSIPPVSVTSTTLRTTSRYTFRTRGTSTTRITRPPTTTSTPVTETSTTIQTTTSTTTPTSTTTSTTTSDVPTTTTPPTTATAASTTTSTTSTTKSDAIPQDSFADPGPYIGIIMALASLLFAILFIVAVVLYFYQGHDSLKKIIKKHAPTQKVKSRKSLHLPSSVLQSFNPHLGIKDAKSSVPSIEPRPLSVRQLSIIISEPLDVTINGIPVARNNSPTEDSTA